MNDPNAEQIRTRQPWADQVARRQHFEAAHPGVTIAFTPEAWTWTGTCEVDGHEHAVTEHELRDLLDKLECLTGKPRRLQGRAGSGCADR